MGRESDDIDLVVDNMSGGDFGNIVKNEQHKGESNEQTAKKVKVIKVCKVIFLIHANRAIQININL